MRMDNGTIEREAIVGVINLIRGWESARVTQGDESPDYVRVQHEQHDPHIVSFWYQEDRRWIGYLLIPGQKPERLVSETFGVMGLGQAASAIVESVETQAWYMAWAQRMQIKIVVEGGVVVDVQGLPSGASYVIEDHDNADVPFLENDAGEDEIQDDESFSSRSRMPAAIRQTIVMQSGSIR